MASIHSIETDTVIIQNLRADSTVGLDRWGKVRSQPISVSCFLETSVSKAGTSDRVSDSIHYGLLFKEIHALVDGGSFDDIAKLAQDVSGIALQKEGAQGVKVVVEAKNQFLMAECLGVSIYRSLQFVTPGERTEMAPRVQLYMKDLKLNILIGVNPPERESKQLVVTNITFHDPTWSSPNWQAIHDDFVQVIESSSFLTLEAFATCVAHSACEVPGAEMVTVRAEKPSALTFADASGGTAFSDSFTNGGNFAILDDTFVSMFGNGFGGS